MPKHIKKLMRKQIRLGLKKAYFLSAIISLLLNTLSPFLLASNYVAYAEEAAESSVSEGTGEVVPTKETVTEVTQPAEDTELTEPTEPQIDSTIVETESVILDEPIPDQVLLVETTEPSQEIVVEEPSSDELEEQPES